jgi:DNA repair exonuclease SbcCD ATPase subunit
LYLTKLAVTDFRTFSECTVNLPSAPGVLLVCGPNGLGKSTLFDGLEWCLTGKVDRFEKASKGVTSDQYLRSWHSQPNRQTTVKAMFSGGLTTHRTIVGSQDVQTGVEPAKLLQADTWRSPIEDLHNYLLLTHFLGQSTLTRMTHKQADQRWEYLKGPARSDWATEIATSMHGHGNSAEARAFVTAIAEAQSQAQRLDDLLRAEETLYQSSSVAGAISEQQVVADVSAALEDLVELTSEVTIPRAEPSSGRRALEQLSAVLAALKAWKAQRDAALGSVDACLRKFNEAGARVSKLRADLVPVGASVLDLQQRAASQLLELQQAQSELQEAKAAQAASELRVTDLGELRALLESKARHEESGRRLETEATELGNALATEEMRVRHTQKRLQLGQSIFDTLQRVLSDLEVEATRDAVRSDLARLDERIALLRNSIATLLGNAPDPELELKEAQARRAGAHERLQAARTTLASARSAVDRLAAAVVGVAAHIDDSTCVCPVCSTNFEPGELRQRAAAAVEAFGPTLGPLEGVVLAADQEVVQAEAGFAAVASKVGELSGMRQNLATLTAERNTKFASLGQNGHLDPAAVAAKMSNLQRRADRARRWLQVVGEPSALQRSWSTALISRNDLAGRLAEVNRARENDHQTVMRSVEDIQFRVQTLGLGASDDIDAQLALARTQKIEADRRVASAAEALQRHQALQGNLNVELVSVTTDQRSLAAAIDASLAEVDQAIATWKDLGMEGELPSNDSRSRAERFLQAAGTRIGKMDQDLTRLRSGLSITLQQKAHREALAQVRSAIAAPASTNRDDTVKLARSAQAQAVATAERYSVAQHVAQAAYQQISRQVGAFNQRYLKPLNDLMNKINRAILTDPDVGLDLEFARNSVRQRARRLKNAPTTVENLDPLLVHSEGQMAALAVSILCAASLNFTWSRWKALVMDDPLQHNDVVHASAFADLMRNLVHDKGYQILLSTHDMGQADFLRRKFAAGNVPCTVVQLVGRSREGTIVKIENKLSSAA